MNAAALKARIEPAKERLLKAEKEMEAAMRAVEQAARVEKSMISAALSSAFNEVKAARLDLAGLEKIITSED